MDNQNEVVLTEEQIEARNAAASAVLKALEPVLTSELAESLGENCGMIFHSVVGTPKELMDAAIATACRSVETYKESLNADEPFLLPSHFKILLDLCSEAAPGDWG